MISCLQSTKQAYLSLDRDFWWPSSSSGIVVVFPFIINHHHHHFNYKLSYLCHVCHHCMVLFHADVYIMIVHSHVRSSSMLVGACRLEANYTQVAHSRHFVLRITADGRPERHNQGCHQFGTCKRLQLSYLPGSWLFCIHTRWWQNSVQGLLFLFVAVGESGICVKQTRFCHG
jgi:hypothetical protein